MNINHTLFANVEMILCLIPSFQDHVSSQQSEMQSLAARELNEKLLDEKNSDIDELTQQVEDLQREGDSLKAQLAMREAEAADMRQEQQERPQEVAVGQDVEQAQLVRSIRHQSFL